MCCLLRPRSRESNMKDSDLTSGEQNLGSLWPESDTHRLTWRTGDRISWLSSVFSLCVLFFHRLLVLSQRAAGCDAAVPLSLGEKKLDKISIWVVIGGLIASNLREQVEQSGESLSGTIQLIVGVGVGGHWPVWGQRKRKANKEIQRSRNKHAVWKVEVLRRIRFALDYSQCTCKTAARVLQEEIWRL